MDAPAAIIEIPLTLMDEIDKAVGSDHRHSFLIEAAEEKLRRERLLEYLRHGAPAWKDKDHPELVNGSYAWVRKLRDEGEARMRALEAQRDVE